MKQGALDLGLPASYDRRDFVRSACNQLVWDWLEKYPSWPSYAAIIVGPQASGKTHLLHIWRSKAKAQLVDDQMDPALVTPPLVIDQADQWQSAAAQKNLFHILNQTKEKGGHVLLTASTPPKQWNVTLKDLESRLLSLPLWQLEPPDETLLTAILMKRFSDAQLLVDPAVIQYIVTRAERSFSTINQMATELNAYALETKRPITIALVRGWLGEALS